MSKLAGHRRRAAVGIVEAEPVAEPEPAGPPEPVAEPRRMADWEDWVLYAASKGADETDIRARNVPKADLIAVWGTRR